MNISDVGGIIKARTRVIGLNILNGVTELCVLCNRGGRKNVRHFFGCDQFWAWYGCVNMLYDSERVIVLNGEWKYKLNH